MNIFNHSMIKNLYGGALLLALIGLLLPSCDSPYTAHAYRDYTPEAIWPYDSVAVFDFNIDNTATAYDISYRIRNTRDYPYYNLYVQCSLLDKDGKVLRQKQDEVYLMHPKTGEPLGNGESLFEHEVKLWEAYEFKEHGKYQFRINQYMRLDTLEGITAVGFSVLPVGDR